MDEYLGICDIPDIGIDDISHTSSVDPFILDISAEMKLF